MQVRNYRYAEFGNTFKKMYFLKIPPKIHIGETPYRCNEFAKFLDQFLQQATRQTMHIRKNKSLVFQH